jgi:hypothetical protein
MNETEDLNRMRGSAGAETFMRRLIRSVRDELNCHEQIRYILDPFLSYGIRCIQPYLLVILLLFVATLFMQAYTAHALYRLLNVTRAPIVSGGGL